MIYRSGVFCIRKTIDHRLNSVGDIPTLAALVSRIDISSSLNDELMYNQGGEKYHSDTLPGGEMQMINEVDASTYFIKGKDASFPFMNPISIPIGKGISVPIPGRQYILPTLGNEGEPSITYWPSKGQWCEMKIKGIMRVGEWKTIYLPK